MKRIVFWDGPRWVPPIIRIACLIGAAIISPVNPTLSIVMLLAAILSALESILDEVKKP